MALYNSYCLLFLVLVALTIIRAHPSSSGHAPSDGPQANNGITLLRCNYTEVGARSCASCQDALICTNLNVGVLIPCRGDRTHCNQGSCSDTPSASCNSTTSRRRFSIHGAVHVHF